MATGIPAEKVLIRRSILLFIHAMTKLKSKRFAETCKESWRKQREALRSQRSLAY
jgi:hypothetical protein